MNEKLSRISRIKYERLCNASSRKSKFRPWLKISIGQICNARAHKVQIEFAISSNLLLQYDGEARKGGKKVYTRVWPIYAVRTRDVIEL